MEKKTVSFAPWTRMSRTRTPSSDRATRVSRRSSGTDDNTGSAALAASSSGKYRRVTTRSRSPRARTERSRCGASVPPSVVGSAPGRTVRIRYRPAESVGLRPKPRNPGTVEVTAPRGSPGWSNLPSGSACQLSTRASVTGSPSPSTTTPVTQNASGVPGGTTCGPSSHSRAMCRNGPTVWDGVSSLIVVLEDAGSLAPQDDVEPEAEGPLRLRRRVVVRRDHPLPGRRIADGVEDRVLGEQRVVREVHLGDEPLGERTAEQREVDVRRPPGVVVVLPGVGAGPDRHEAVVALGVGQRAAHPGEVRVERGRPRVGDVAVASGRVGLPDLDERVGYGSAVGLEHLTGHDDPLAGGLGGVLAGQVVVELADPPLPEHGAGDLGQPVRQRHQRLGGVPHRLTEVTGPVLG